MTEWFSAVALPKEKAWVRRRPSGHKVYLRFEVQYRGEPICAFDREDRARAYAQRLNQAMRKSHVRSD